jgi:hypothetical protein
MIVVFNCPHCRRTLRADDYFSGKKIQCRTCKTILFVPGAPPVRDGHTPDAEIAYAPPDNSQQDEAAATLVAPDPKDQSDASYGIASLCLAAFTFFLSPMVAVAMIAPIPILGIKYGMPVGLLAGAYASAYCYLFSRHGYQFAIKAEGYPTGQGYAAAGKIINKFLLRIYGHTIALLILGGIVTLILAIFTKHSDPLQDTLKMLDQVKGLGQ